MLEMEIEYKTNTVGRVIMSGLVVGTRRSYVPEEYTTIISTTAAVILAAAFYSNICTNLDYAIRNE